MRWLLWCFCLLAESYETINHWPLMILHPATSTHSYSVTDCSGGWSTSDHSNLSWTNVARPWFLLRTDPASEKLESLTFLQFCSGSPVGRWWKPCSYRLAAQWRRSFCSQPLGVQLEYVGSWVFDSISASVPRPEKGVFLLISVTVIGGRSTPELCFLPGRLRWKLLSKERYGNSLSGCGSNT